MFHQCPTHLDRAPGRHLRQGTRMHQRRPPYEHGQRSRGGDERHRHPDYPDQRRGLHATTPDALIAKIKEIGG